MSLINSLTNQPAKKAFQTYTIKHGIETLAVMVPLAEAAQFEAAFDLLEQPSKTVLLDMVKAHGGKAAPTTGRI